MEVQTCAQYGHNDMGHNSTCDLTANQSLEILKSNGSEMQTATCRIHLLVVKQSPTIVMSTRAID
jgi:uncharacterized protein (DUF2237 family)